QPPVRQRQPQPRIGWPALDAGPVGRFRRSAEATGFQVESGGQIAPRLGARRQLAGSERHHAPGIPTLPGPQEGGKPDPVPAYGSGTQDQLPTLRLITDYHGVMPYRPPRS